jgi:hypothetical protein
MKRLRHRPPWQLVLSLERETRVPPVVADSEALLQALADLLLEALGRDIEETASDEESDDEREDHC